MRQSMILLVGPSGVGKTSAYEAVEDRFPSCIFRHLDGLASESGVRLGWLHSANVSALRRHIDDDQLFLAFGLESVGMLASHHPNKHIVIDVGAGFQDARSARLLHRIHDVVAITASPFVAYQRICQRPEEKRSFDQYASCEFSEHRAKVYSQTQQIVDTTSLTLPETADTLASILRGILGS